MDHKRSSRFRLILTVLILCSCIGCDQATKTIAVRALRDASPRVYLGDTVRLDFALNPGGFLSLGSNLPDQFRTGIFVAINSALMLGITFFLCRRQSIPFALLVSLALILAGGIGNLIDRVANRGLVIDFINIGVGPVRTGVFNVADVAITFGAIALACLLFRRDAGAQSIDSGAGDTTPH
jgi:signal peptidase II